MSDTLLSPSSVRLFGRELAGVRLDPTAVGNGLGANSFLRAQLKDEAARLAMIYGFTFQGQYQPLAQPALFLVHTAGTKVETGKPDPSGVARSGDQFGDDINYWDYDRADFSLRLDVNSGPLERILLAAEAPEGDMPYFRGAHTRYRGAHVSFRGAHVTGQGSGE